jgi:hypothetical protein
MRYAQVLGGLLASVVGVLAEAYGQHRYLVVEGVLAADDAEVFAAILHRRADRAQLVGALRLLSRLLAEHHREKVVMLIDEYDSPIHAGYTNQIRERDYAAELRERGAAPIQAFHGSNTGTPVGPMSAVFRVTKVRPWWSAVAASCASTVGSVNRRLFATASRWPHRSATPSSKTRSLPANLMRTSRASQL